MFGEKGPDPIIGMIVDRPGLALGVRRQRKPASVLPPAGSAETLRPKGTSNQRPWFCIERGGSEMVSRTGFEPATTELRVHRLVHLSLLFITIYSVSDFYPRPILARLRRAESVPPGRFSLTK